MATITICDRCATKINGNEGMQLKVTDMTRGMAGDWVLCGGCSSAFTAWWDEMKRLVLEVGG